MAQLQVELVAADRNVWSGEADIVIARTVEGDVGVLPGHAPLLGLLVSGPVTIRESGGGVVRAAVHGGFLSVADDLVSILAEVAELADDIDSSRAQQALDRATGDDDEDARRRAETRLALAGQGR